MKTQLKITGGILILMAFATMQLFGQARTGGGFGGGGFGGGFGGFGGGFGGFNRGAFGGNNSSTAATEYNNNGTVGNATIEVDPDTHNIIVIADSQTSMQISNVIANMDHPKPQVLIKVVFLEVQLNNAEALGVQGSYTPNESWFHQLTGFMTNFSTVGTNIITTVSPVYQTFNVNHNFGLPQTLPGATGNAGVYSVLGSDFTATLQAIATAGKAQILSRPSILARDGQPATILVGQEVPLITGISYYSVSGSTVPINNVTYTPVGLQVNVTP
ncbi:MAG TPA: hypothetical protein VME24_09345, partial [Alphaproteobacteria bacterium]|nr:hypothetical protein [Alphaproteobacteria bacterium]